ncbi:MAG: YjbE family putative metal transport protein [Alphaproteobacteria bacterium]
MMEAVGGFGLIQIIFADIILSGDNALIIGMAASSLAVGYRAKAIAYGMAAAAILRIMFAAAATYLMAIPGILFIGGLLLAWVCWRFFTELRCHARGGDTPTASVACAPRSDRRQFIAALTTIMIADVSMSIDNVVAVAAIARDNLMLLVFGLGLSIALMGFCATLVVRLLTRQPWISYAGLGFLVYLSLDMIHDGWPHVAAMAQSAMAG